MAREWVGTVMRTMSSVAVATAIFAGCAAHEDVTPEIPIQPGAAARAMALMPGGGPNSPWKPPPVAPDAGTGEATEPTDAPGLLVFTCLEPRAATKGLGRVPCEVNVAPKEGGDPVAALASETGKVRLTLPGGDYRVTASRGYEYDRASWDVTVTPGLTTWGPNDGATVLHRVVDTRGYLASDVDLELWGGRDARAAVLADVAAGVELAGGDDAFSLAALRAVETDRIEDFVVPLSIRSIVPPLEAFAAFDDRAGFFSRLLAKQAVTAVGSRPVRTYVRVDDDGPLTTWSPAREADFVRGLRDRRDVVLTTGPFLRVTANAMPIGALVRPVAGVVEVKVHVECAPWLAVDRVSVLRAGGAEVEPRLVTLAPIASGALAADAVVRFAAAADDAFVVVADSPADPDAGSGPAPRAMTGAIWIDGDGDGEAFGRKR
jgi:hypothetical protein